MKDWQFQQTVNTLRIVYVDIVKPEWANRFDWDYWISSSKDLPADHATIARISPETVTA